MMSSGFNVILSISRWFPIWGLYCLIASLLMITRQLPAASAMHPGLSGTPAEIGTLFLNSSNNIPETEFHWLLLRHVSILQPVTVASGSD